MKYPDDFNTPAMPEGKFVAVSRFMGTAVSCIFFLIVCLCGIIFWVKKTQDVKPFLISINPNGERWTVVAHDAPKTQIPAYYVLQESLLNHFVRDWFTVSADANANSERWEKCNRETHCSGGVNNNENVCAIYCVTTTDVWDNFDKVVRPVFAELADNGDVWTVQSVSVKPVNSIDSITRADGLWKIRVVVKTADAPVLFTGFARTGYDKTQYPKTMGYYVAEFNMYRMN